MLSPAGSIAVSTIVRPSIWIKIAFITIGTLCLLTALAIFFQQASSIGLIARSLILVAGITLALIIALEHKKYSICWALDMSGVADIRLARLLKPNDFSSPNSESTPAKICYLAPGSLITPILLVLRIADSHDKINTLLIFPDSVSEDAYRRLSLACRWLATQRDRRPQND